MMASFSKHNGKLVVKNEISGDEMSSKMYFLYFFQEVLPYPQHFVTPFVYSK